MTIQSAIKFCEICQKPFHQEIAYKRHVSYCRKQARRQKTRKISCTACKIVKVRCEADPAGGCERCKRKGVDCTYGERGQISVVAEQVRRTSSWSVNGAVSESTADSQVAAVTKDRAISSFISPVIPDRDNLDPLDLQITDKEVSFMDIIDLPYNFPTILSPKSSYKQNSHPLPHPYHLKIEPNQDWPAIFRLALIPDPYTSALLPNTIDKWVLRPNPMSTPTAQTHSTRVIRMLRSIPRMMAHRDTFPPFIHGHWHRQLPGPLATCINTAKLFCDREIGRSASVWRIIRKEQESLAARLYDFESEGLVAALQSYLVYMIMRVEDETGGTAGDVPMLMSFKAMSDWCYHMFGGVPPQPETEYDPTMTWETWVFRESKRRCALLYFLVGRVFTIFTNNVCPCTSMPTTLPLPAPRNVWEAQTQSAWSTAYQDLFQRDRLFTFGDLLGEMRAYGTGSSEKLDEWHCGMDYLGSLLESATGMF